SKGGPGAGNLVIFVASSNFGKTAWCTACARHANSLGKNVVFFSFEIGGIDIIKRYISGAVGLKQEELKYNQERVKTAVIDSTLGNFKLVEERATNANVEQIRITLEYLKSTGFFPDEVYVDSINQIKTNTWRDKDDNQRFEYVCEELRDLSNDYEVPIISPMQTNRQGFNSEVGDVSQIGKAIEPFQVADMLIIASQTETMFAENRCVLLLLKNRLGPRNIVIECSYDPNMGLFKELKEVPELLLLKDKEKKQLGQAAS